MRKFEKKYQVWQDNGYEGWDVYEEFDSLKEISEKYDDNSGDDIAITSRVDIEIKEKN